MRVTHVITRLILGGAQENTVASVLGLNQLPGWHVRLISGPTTGPEGSLESSFSKTPHLLTVLPSLVRPIRPWHDCRVLVQLTRWFRAQSPDLVHTHSGKAGVLGRLAARFAKVPLIVHTIHGPSFGAFQNPIANHLFRAAELGAARCTTHFVSVAEAMTRQYLAAGIGRPERFSLIRSGFELRAFLAATNDPKFRASLGIAPLDFVVGKIARLTPLKGHDDLIDAAPSLVNSCPQIKFLLVGDGPWRERLETKVRVLGLKSHFVFAGLVPPEAIPRYVGIMDVLAHLSRREGLARALPQALAAGRPIVAYACDGADEICLPGQTGFLIRPGEWHELPKHLLELARDPALRERLGQEGRRRVQEQFPVERMVHDLAGLYRRLNSDPPKSGEQRGLY